MANPKLIRRVQRNPALLKRMLKNPGQRARLPDRLLTPELRAQRRTNARLRQPVTPGSTMTERDIARESKAAMAVKYGPVETAQRQQLGEAQNYQRDIAGYYDDYLKSIARQAANVRAIGAQAGQQIQGLQAGVTGLAGADLQGLQAPANADAAARGATAGDLSGMASNAAAVRQALVASFGAQQAAQSDAASRYADMLATNVAPGQKLQAVAGAAGRVRQVREQQAATAREKGAADIAFRGERRGEEAKQVLAQQVAGGKAAGEAFERRQTRREFREKKRATRASERLQGERIKVGQEQAAGKVNQYGYTDRDWRAMSTQERRKIIAKGGGKGGGGGGAKLTPGQSGAGLSQAVKLKEFALKAKKGRPFIEGHDKGPKAGDFRPLSKQEAVDKILRSAPSLKHPALAQGAADIVYDGHLSSSTIKALRKAGYSPREFARMLGAGALVRANTRASRGHGLPAEVGHQ